MSKYIKRKSGPFRDPEPNEVYLGDALRGLRNCECGNIKPWHVEQCDKCAKKDTRGIEADKEIDE